MFCVNHHFSFPPKDTVALSNFLCYVADSSTKPRSKLNTVCAALSCYHEAYELLNIVHNPDIVRLTQALVKSGTSQTLTHSQVMPVELNALFTCWGENEKHSLKRLRQKAITLLALVTMLRPSYVAPKSVHFDPFSFEHEKMQFNTDQIVFESSGSMRISFHGIKHDTSRSGFQVVVPPATNILLDPVKTLRDFIERSMSHRKISASGNAVFLSLYSPYKSLSAQTIASVLEDSIADAGLDKNCIQQNRLEQLVPLFKLKKVLIQRLL